ncbi:hypothetical protein PR202_ga05649 [Eleusine coracana subsp. coracana]|uniref:Tubby-like F-box protein n=1 Tax=Eleusine coracana subsp. coracana TaxID=191504 RepID=A0AAV5BWE8_ELECO|nr:hypothetical protein PR202_ga05195 [Eleusine coracana subsp. coracana]GJM89454.1 hypothetical protein PR202_ga05649 [Eleusine coracana subsp. coracana]
MVSWRRSASWLSSASRSSLPGGVGGGEAKVTPEVDPAAAGAEEPDEERWSRLLPELLTEIVRRVDAGAERWPPRRDVVACACVCRRWARRRGLRRAAAARVREDHLSLLAQAGSSSYVGKLRSDFLGTKFIIYDSQAPYDGAKPSRSRSTRRFASKQISPQVSGGNFEVGQVTYKFNFLKTRGPRRMQCSMQCPVVQGTASDPSKEKTPAPSFLDLKNKAPRWHEHLQCWCLNFHGRVTVASVKNFQLVATAGTGGPWGVGDEETVILQFGKIEDDTFTMDYRQPLSAFQAFAICLTSFGTKLACE